MNPSVTQTSPDVAVPRRVVVDTSVGRGAADPDKVERGMRVDPGALQRLDLLWAIWKNGHCAVSPPELWQEWQKHQRRSYAMTRWLTNMAQRRLVVRPTVTPTIPELESAIRTLSGKEQQAACKDYFLPATAMEIADERIFSDDKRARKTFASLVSVCSELAPLHWVRSEWSGVVEWIAAGMPDRPEWTLGAGQQPVAGG